MNEPLTQLHAEAMTAEREWTVEEIPVLSASAASISRRFHPLRRGKKADRGTG